MLTVATLVKNIIVKVTNSFLQCMWTMIMSMLLSGGTTVCQYSTHLEHSSPHLVEGAVERENWSSQMGSPLTRMDSCMSVTLTIIVFKSFEQLCLYIAYWCCLPFVICMVTACAELMQWTMHVVCNVFMAP